MQKIANNKHCEGIVQTNLIAEINRLQQELDSVKQRLRIAEKQYKFDDIAGSDPVL